MRLLISQKFNADNQVKRFRERVEELETQKIQRDTLAFDNILDDVVRPEYDTIVPGSIQAGANQRQRAAAAQVTANYLGVPVSPANAADGGSDDNRLPEQTNPMHSHSSSAFGKQ